MKRIILTFIVLSFSFFSQLTAQGFGQNKVQYKDFKWHYLQTEHFDIYFYPGGYEISTFAAEVCEDAYKLLKRDFKYELSKRVSIVLYKSHNDFQQTNVVSTYLPEGVGGVTELYKNRVVVPFEGSYAAFRHVLHHELVHAVMNDMLYGGSVQALISGNITQVPTWFAEGLAEYFSQRWNTKTDMMVRDATITGYLIEALPTYGAYFGGNSFFRYLAERYGNEKIGEILHKLKGSFRFESAFKSAIGVELNDLAEQWQKQMRKEYWPDLPNRMEPKEFGRALTDHRKERSYLNISPAISPAGDKVLYLSNKSGKQSLYIMDLLDKENSKKIIEGETDLDFEELHWLSPGMGWSPDARKVTFTAKAGDQDALYIYDVKSEDTQQYKFGLDGLFSAAWSPKGNEIAFVGNFNGQGDIYVFNIHTKKLEKITDDMFSDNYPRWSNDGTKIAFVSERGSYTDMALLPENLKMSEHDYENTDIYIVDRQNKQIRQVTNTPYLETDPVFSPNDDKLLYVSDATGISNIYHHDLETDKAFPISNLLTGAFQLSINKAGNTLLFTSFNEIGFDIFSLKNPFEKTEVKVEKTEFFKKLDDKKSLLSTVDNLEEDISQSDSLANKVELKKTNDFSRFVFANLNRKKAREKKQVKLDEGTYKREDGKYKVRNYKVKFTPDLIQGQAGYDTFFGFQGFTQLAYSDVLGNHRINLGTNLVFDLRNSYIVAQYFYLANRTDYGVTVYHSANTLQRRYTYSFGRYRNYGAQFIASRPFSKFTRADFSLNFLNAEYEELEDGGRFESLSGLLPTIQLVHDNSDWFYSGPGRGFRGALTLTTSPKYNNKSLQFTTVKADLRKYYSFFDYYNIALRLSTGASFGADPQNFYFGGTPNWINREFNVEEARRISSVEDVYFSEFVTPVRGARYYEQVGHNFALFNGEFRFPLFTRMDLGFPPISIGYIQGLFFTDIGSAWNDNKKLRLFNAGYADDLFIGYGMGARIPLLGFLLKYEMAYEYDGQNSSKPKHYFSIGLDF